ncbi:MAG: hypothetical protein ABSE73_08310 [Planctomycetota bacterium]
MRYEPPGLLLKICVWLLFLSWPLCGAEKVPVHINGQVTECEVVKVTKEGAVLKPFGKELNFPLEKLDPKDVARCYKAIPRPASATTRLEMGAYFLAKSLLAEAEEEATAVQADPACKDKAGALLAAIKVLKEVETKAKEPKEPAGGKQDPGESSGEPGEGTGENADLTKGFAEMDVPPRSPAEMKAFLDKRLEELKALGGTWNMKETKHFYYFSEVPETKYGPFSQWNELLYERLCGVLRHHEGDKLWNNKMPIYYFSSHAKFRQFAAAVDHNPGAAMSGGYFLPEGRQVHICIPFYSERFPNNDKTISRLARNTLHHECTHAFLQLTGENVPLTKWLHEGMAQFIEFFYDHENNPDGREDNPQRKQRVKHLQMCLARNYLPSWAEMQNRPVGGMDLTGYTFAWTKVEFLYRNFPHEKLPEMVKLIKAGKKEEDAMAAAFGIKYDRLEEGYRQWVKVAAKTSFNFAQ